MIRNILFVGIFTFDLKLRSLSEWLLASCMAHCPLLCTFQLSVDPYLFETCGLFSGIIGDIKSIHCIEIAENEWPKIRQQKNYSDKQREKKREGEKKNNQMPIALIYDNDNHRLTQPQNQFVQILIECFSGSINSSWAYRWTCIQYTSSVFYVKERVNTSTKIINMIVCSVEPTKPTEWHAKAKYKKSVHLPVFSSFAARYLCRFNQITYLHMAQPYGFSLYAAQIWGFSFLSSSWVLFFHRYLIS